MWLYERLPFAVTLGAHCESQRETLASVVAAPAASLEPLSAISVAIIDTTTQIEQKTPRRKW